jgi:hypothetical protein
MRIKLHITEQGRKNQNHPAEHEIGNLAKRWKLRMTKKQVPKRLWDFGLVYESELLSRMARGRDSRTGYEEVTGQTPDIGEWLDFEFYDLVWWLDCPNKPNITDKVRRLARWIGVLHRVGSNLCYWLITESGKIISKSSVDEFNQKLQDALSDDSFIVDDDGNHETAYMLEDIEEEDLNPGVRSTRNPTTPTDEEFDDMQLSEQHPEVDDDDAIDKYLTAELILDIGSGNERRGRVMKRSRGQDGEPIGRAHTNPLFDTREYDVEFTDGTIDKYQTNVIAENMFAQVDDKGNQFLLLEEIQDHKKDHSAVLIADGKITTSSGTSRLKKTTQGWQLLILWKDGSSSWEHLRDLKESNPELAEYAVANRLVDEPAFAWWVPHVIRKRNRIISKVKNCYWRQTHKYGVKLPHSVDEALEIDIRLTGTRN